VVSSISYNSVASAKNVLFLADVELWELKNYWISPNGVARHFILDLGCIKMFSKIRLVNTHNGTARNRNTKEFK